MSRKIHGQVHCPRCGQDMIAGRGAHKCRHGKPCWFKRRADGMPLDWKTLECPECKNEGHRYLSRVWQPTESGWSVDIPEWRLKAASDALASCHRI